MDRRKLFIAFLAGGRKTTSPSFAISVVSTLANVVSMQITASKEVVGFSVGDITISAGGSLANFATADNIVFTVDWTLAAGENTMDIAAGVCQDTVGNNNLAATQFVAGFLTIQPNAADGMDTNILLDGPDINQATANTAVIGESNEAIGRIRRLLIKFDLTSLPGNCTIASAILSLFETEDISSNNRDLKVYRLKRPWVESQATWNIYSTGNSWQTAGGFGVDDCDQTPIATRSFSSTETINQFKDFQLIPTSKSTLDFGYGWLIKADTELNDAHVFATSDNATAANRPKLTLVYYVP